MQWAGQRVAPSGALRTWRSASGRTSHKVPHIAGLWADRRASPLSRAVSGHRVDLGRPAAWSRPRPSASLPSQRVPLRPVYKSVYRTGSWPVAFCASTGENTRAPASRFTPSPSAARTWSGPEPAVFKSVR